ncbi:MAG: GNAT family N-acetyltransferase, partial [Caldisphaera sp.]|nr:GNAT family N-acetyltransferase [Caldisphaera sp.]
PYKDNDMKSILKIEEESFPEGKRYSELIIGYLLSMKGSKLFVAEINNCLIGYSLGYMESPTIGHVASIAVKQDFRNKGIGTMLIIYLEKELEKEGAKFLKLEVSLNNEDAKKLYLRLGYKPATLLPNYYGKTDGLLMIKDLNPKI